MNRLTKEDILKFPMTVYGRSIGKQLSAQVVSELLKYKQLEEDLGCPLEVIFKALKDGFYDEYGALYKVGEFYLDYNWLLSNPGDKYLTFNVEDTYFEFKLNDYKKTWWLKENKKE